MIMNLHPKSVNTFVKSYIATALWSSTDDNDEPLDIGDYDLAEETKATMHDQCIKFLEIANDEIIKYRENFQSAKIMYSYAGHDFWLTRNGHGAGFWDSPELWDDGEKLTELCEYQTVDLYVGDDNLIYIM